jgi:uncharacterized circularly permuted ATP-grasp superfamily protein/uncharacterized alpha-E superfamily protein
MLDEMKTASGELRPHWGEFVDTLATLTPYELAQRWEMGQSLLRENGVTYNSHGDTGGLDRPWQLDPIPVIIPAEEWKTVTRAVAQRATLLNAILGDFYGRRELFSKRVIPPALLYANTHFLRPAHGWQPAGGNHLQVYAADLARGQDGNWKVVADRSEVPAGAGYALENRTIVSRVLPEPIRAMPVERLGPFFDTMRRSLQALSPRRTDEPRVVLLTPGPYNETYFEHAFLARQMGVTLVQGEDLTVRDNTVFLKTLSGLQRVDVILRRTASEWCDPLEFRGDSTLGVVGLVQAARAGNVAVTNALGAGVVEGGALMAFLPTIASHLLRENLVLPSVDTWWCGQEEECRYVLANLDRLLLRPAFRSRLRPVLGNTLDEGPRSRLAAAIRARPWDWVAQEMGGMSTVPVWSDGRLVSQHLVVRVFAVASDNGWQVMRGGLARVSNEKDLMTSRLQSGGGGSKDLWVLASPEQHTMPVIRGPAPPVRLTRGNRDLPSRVADDMYWLGRYLERCETTTRLLRAALQRMEEVLDQGDSDRAGEILEVMAGLGLAVPPQGLEGGAPEELPSRLIRYHADTAGAGLNASAERLVRVAVNLRDRLSIDTWRVLQRLRDETGRLNAEYDRGDVLSRLNTVVLTVEAVNGLAMENMTRGPLWLFMDAGRRVERAVAIVDTLGGALSEATGEYSVPMELLLEVWDSVMTYRSRYLAAPRLAAVLDLLLCDESNPRSLGFQLAALSAHMDRLAVTSGETGFLRPEQRLMTVLCGIVRTTDVVAMANYDPDGGFADAERLLETFRSRLWELSEVLSREHFVHALWRLPRQPTELLA